MVLLLRARCDWNENLYHQFGNTDGEGIIPHIHLPRITLYSSIVDVISPMSFLFMLSLSSISSLYLFARLIANPGKYIEWHESSVGNFTC